MREDSEQFVNARFGGSFTFSLLNEKVVLEPGTYVVMVDPHWNETSDNDPGYREVLLDIYAPKQVTMSEVDTATGMHLLAQSLKHAARTRTAESDKQFYLSDESDYGNDVHRISDIECLNCWLGFVYTANNSPYTLKETLKLNLEGIEILYPPTTEEIELKVAAGEEHIVVLRRVDGGCSYGLQYLTHPRELSDAEIQEKTKD